jgi:hypothetical protein
MFWRIIVKSATSSSSVSTTEMAASVVHKIKTISVQTKLSIWQKNA